MHLHKHVGEREEASACTGLDAFAEAQEDPRREVYDLQRRTDHLRATIRPLEGAWQFSSPLSSSPLLFLGRAL